jgi:NhaC family Na+:H+ antiporter
MNIKKNVLSRTLETSATLGCAVLPWGVVSVYIQNVLDVGLNYIPYTFLPFIAPVITLIYAFTGFALFKRDTPAT